MGNKSSADSNNKMSLFANNNNNNNNNDDYEPNNKDEDINKTKMKMTESDILLDQDQVQLRVFPNKESDGFTVKVLTYRKRYNESFDLPSDATLFNFLHKLFLYVQYP